MKTNDLIPEDQLLKLNKLKEKLPKDEDNETYLEDNETVETVLTESDTKSEPITETEVTESDTPTVEVPKPETWLAIMKKLIVIITKPAANFTGEMGSLSFALK